jgi:hypothetical protein
LQVVYVLGVGHDQWSLAVRACDSPPDQWRVARMMVWRRNF